MPNYGRNYKICSVLVIITILGIIILPLAVVLSTNASAQTVHDRTLNEVLKQGSGLESIGNSPIDMIVDAEKNVLYLLNNGSESISVISTINYTKLSDDIPVGDNPVSWAYSYDEGNIIDKIYVANAGSDSVSVISTKNHSKIGEDILEFDPLDIAVIENNPLDLVREYTIYVTSNYTNELSVINDTNHIKIRPVYVGENPTAIAYAPPMIYVANAGSDSVSVISTTDLSHASDDIPVGDNPTAIAYDPYHSYGVYVANAGSDSVSVINGTTNKKIGDDIPVGDNPTAIAFDPHLDIMYVANAGSDSVSVISTINYTKLSDDIPVGDNPTAIDFNLDTHAVLVANSDSDGISVIDNVAGKVVEGLTFHVSPFNSGYIVCSDLITPSPDDDFTRPSPVGQYIYVYSGTKCIAKPNEGFEFSSWEENLRDNATQPISVAPSTTPLDSFLEFLQLESADKPEAALDITKIGSFTANFREAPPPLPQEFWVQMYAVIGTVVTALFIPSIVGWIRSKRDVKRLNYYHKQIASLYDDGKLDENDIEALDRLRNRVSDAYSEGKVNEKHYETLGGEISNLYEEIFRKKIAMLDGKNNNYSVVKKPIQEQLSQIRNEIEYAFSKGKINEKHYDLLTKAISNLDSKENASQ